MERQPVAAESRLHFHSRQNLNRLALADDDLISPVHRDDHDVRMDQRFDLQHMAPDVYFTPDSDSDTECQITTLPFRC